MHAQYCPNSNLLRADRDTYWYRKGIRDVVDSLINFTGEGSGIPQGTVIRLQTKLRKNYGLEE